MTDKRKSKRLEKEALANYVVVKDMQIMDEGISKMENMSESGIQLALPKEHRKDDRLLLSLNLDGELVEARGTVRWSIPRDDLWITGIEVDETDPSYLRKFKDFQAA